MKIKSTYAGYVTILNIGKYGFFLELGEDGVDMKLNDIAQMCSNYNYVIIKNIVKDSTHDINQLIKKILVLSPKTKVELNVTGEHLPPNAGSYDRTIYNVFIDYSIEYEKKIIKWLKEASANFIFRLNTEDDLDKINTFIRKYEIDKNSVVIMLEDVSITLLNLIRLCGYSITFDTGSIIENEKLE